MLTRLCFYLKGACFGLDNDHYQAQKYKVITRQLKMQYTQHPHVLRGLPQCRILLFCSSLKLYAVNSN